MSSGVPYGSTKRPLEGTGACDLCRRRKGAYVCGAKHLALQEPRVLHVAKPVLTAHISKRRTQTPDQKGAYVQSLEARLEQSLAVIQELRNDLAVAYFNHSTAPLLRAPPSPIFPNKASFRKPPLPQAMSSGPWRHARATDTKMETMDANPLDRHAACMSVIHATLNSLSVSPPPPHPDDLLHLDVDHKPLTPGYSYIGRSSTALLVRAAFELKMDTRAGDESVNPELPDAQHDHENKDSWISWASRWRPQYWTPKPWEIHGHRSETGMVLQHSSYTFPPLEVLTQLVDLYFTHSEVYLPLLHRPTFERDVAKEAHLRDDNFAATVLLVCAIASRWSDDPRASGIETQATSSSMDHLACGWKWFNQVSPQRIHLFGQATLPVLQYYCVLVRFLHGTIAMETCWTLIGVGLRLAQDVGAHRHQGSVEQPSVERELWKRAFWTLVYMDRIMSAELGRSLVVEYIEFDTALLIEADEECWQDPLRPFCQPPGVPARAAFFNTLLQLNHILAHGIKSLYSHTKMRTLFDLKDGWEDTVVAQLDSALDTWFGQLPVHLRWDPARVDPVHFDQSVALHCAYYYTRIFVHRASTALPSLIICTDAARACADMVNTQRLRKGNVPVAMNISAVFTSGVVLLVSMMSKRRMGHEPDIRRGLADVHKCMEVIRLCEDRWQVAGVYWDILSDFNLPNENDPKPPSGRKAMVSSNANRTTQTYSNSLSGAHLSRILRNPETFGHAPLELSTFALVPDQWRI
ncbi:fungal-specific transcription factor domain-containing protein [Mycena crocata]|nr:fungal-specific transcription factor domain-containing protein [Mycena crocata]